MIFSYHPLPHLSHLSFLLSYQAAFLHPFLLSFAVLGPLLIKPFLFFTTKFVFAIFRMLLFYFLLFIPSFNKDYKTTNFIQLDY
jgi:hypothetical protein